MLPLYGFFPQNAMVTLVSEVAIRDVSVRRASIVN